VKGFNKGPGVQVTDSETPACATTRKKVGGHELKKEGNGERVSYADHKLGYANSCRKETCGLGKCSRSAKDMGWRSVGKGKVGKRHHSQSVGQKSNPASSKGERPSKLHGSGKIILANIAKNEGKILKNRAETRREKILEGNHQGEGFSITECAEGGWGGGEKCVVGRR